MPYQFMLENNTMLATEHEIRENLAAAYQIIALLGYDDLTYTHLSARIPQSNNFFILPFGLLFSEVTAAKLLKVDLDGNVLEGTEYQYNKTGYVIHGSIYKHRADLNAIFHLHTPAIIAVSAMREGLLPISQFALHFYNHLSYHDYDSLALTLAEHEQNLIISLGTNKSMLLRNHGALTCGTTIHEAFFYTHHLQQACEVQCQAMSARKQLVLPDDNICQKAVQDLLSFEADLGLRDWQALLRLLDRKSIDYKG